MAQLSNLDLIRAMAKLDGLVDVYGDGKGWAPASEPESAQFLKSEIPPYLDPERGPGILLKLALKTGIDATISTTRNANGFIGYIAMVVVIGAAGELRRRFCEKTVVDENPAVALASAIALALAEVEGEGFTIEPRLALAARPSPHGGT